MKKFVLLWVLVVTGGGGALGQAETHAERPNLLLILSDDQGWGDVGFRGHPRLETPHLDAMAANGLVLDRFYAAAPVCSPTRASIMTGKHPMRLGIPGANKGHLPHAERTLAEIASDAGYRTGFFGKWHLGTLTTTRVDSNRGGRDEHRAHFTTPDEHGFHVWFATEAKVPTFDPMVDPDSDPASDEPYGTAYWNGGAGPVEDNLAGDDSRVIVDRAAPFIRDAVDKGRPFLAVVWFHSPHLPIVVDPEMAARYEDVADAETREYYACISAMDGQVGRLRALVRELGVADTTLVWFGSDNGPEGGVDDPGSTGGLRGRKRDLWEGGVRVPGIVEWPGRVAPGGRTDVPVVTSDMVPTIASVLGIDTPRGLDGVDVSALLRGEAFARELPIAFWAGKKRALIDGRYKAVSVDPEEGWRLFDLGSSTAEQVEIDAPDRLDRMVSAFARWRSTIEGD